MPNDLRPEDYIAAMLMGVLCALVIFVAAHMWPGTWLGGLR